MFCQMDLLCKQFGTSYSALCFTILVNNHVLCKMTFKCNDEANVSQVNSKSVV